MYKQFPCSYCGRPSILIEKEKKVFLICPICGKMEWTPKLKKKLEELKKKQ